MAEEYIAADPERLMAGGINMAQISAIITSLYEEMDFTVAHFSYSAGGDDHLAEMLETVYKPAEAACLEFVKMLANLIVQHGESVVGAGKVLGTADTDAITSVTKK